VRIFKIEVGGLSNEDQARIAAAQQKRWAKVRREKSKAAKASKVALAIPATK
jgi:hypothetical protein